MTLSAKLVVQLAATLTDALDLSTPADALDYVFRDTLTSGTGADQADMLWHDRRTVNASSNEDLDLAGSLTNAFGDTQTFARIKAVIIAAAAGNTNNVRVTRPASNGVPLFLAASDGLDVRPGGVFAWYAPDATAVAVTAGSGDLLNIANSSSGTSVTYDIIVIGASA